MHSAVAKRDVVLDLEDISERAVVAFRPEVIAIGDVEELRGDAQARAGPPHTPFEDGRHVQLAANLTNVHVASTKSKGRRARGHAQPPELRQGVNEFFRQAIAEVLAVGIRVPVGKRQHGNRLLVRACLQRRRGGLHLGDQLDREVQVAGRLKPIARIFFETAVDDARERRRGTGAEPEVRRLLPVALIVSAAVSPVNARAPLSSS